MNTNENRYREKRLLVQAIKQERDYFLTMAVALFILTFLLLYLVGQVPREIGIILSLICFANILVGFKLLYESIRNFDIHNCELYKIIEEDPLKIVWIYSTLTYSSPYGINLFNSGIIYFKLIDGNQIELRISRSVLKELMSELHQLLPHSSFGHSEEKEQWYMAEPTLLLKSADEMN